MKVSSLIENNATDKQKANGYDIADYLIEQQNEINQSNEIIDSCNAKLETVLNDESLLNDFYTILDEQKAFATNCFIFSTLNAKKAPLANSMRFGNCLTSFAHLPEIKTVVYKLSGAGGIS